MANFKREAPPSCYAIYDYWKDKCITEDGEICEEGKFDYSKSVKVVVDCGEPSCFMCDLFGLTRKYINGKYQSDLEDNNFKSIWSEKNISGLQKAHIVPHALGGLNTPNNYFLLCPICHQESPDTSYPKYFLKYVYYRRKHPRIFECLKASFSNHSNEEFEKMPTDIGTICPDALRKLIFSNSTTHFNMTSFSTIQSLVDHIVDSAIDGSLEQEISAYDVQQTDK